MKEYGPARGARGASFPGAAAAAAAGPRQRLAWLAVGAVLLVALYVLGSAGGRAALFSGGGGGLAGPAARSGLAAGPAAAADLGPAPRNYAVISTGSAPLYSFFLPITALIWRRRQQYEPIILLVNDVGPTGAGAWGSDAPTAAILKYLGLWGFGQSHLSLDHDALLPKNNAVVSQVSRAYVAALCGLRGPLRGLNDPQAFLVTTDVDIFPIAPGAYFRPEQPRSWGRVTNAFCCDTTVVFEHNRTVVREYPMTTIGYTVEAWRRIMGYGCLCDLSAAPPQGRGGPRKGRGGGGGRRAGGEGAKGAEGGGAGGAPAPCLGEVVRRVNADMVRTYRYGAADQTVGSWYLDQNYVSWRIHDDTEAHNRTELVRREVYKDRLCRSHWTYRDWTPEALEGLVDSHVLRPGYEEEAWGALRKLLRPLLAVNESREADRELWAQLEQYREEYKAAVEAGGGGEEPRGGER